jgi:hypothetical protein
LCNSANPILFGVKRLGRLMIVDRGCLVLGGELFTSHNAPTILQVERWRASGGSGEQQQRQKRRQQTLTSSCVCEMRFVVVVVVVGHLLFLIVLIK